MSKTARLVEKSLDKKFSSRQEVAGTAGMVVGGKRSLSRDEAIKLFGEAADMLDVQFSRLDVNIKALMTAELAASEHARELIGRSKDLAAKVGDAMVRIDKIVVKDFEVKLQQLERFTAAMQALNSLKESGRLDAIVAAFNRQA